MYIPRRALTAPALLALLVAAPSLTAAHAVLVRSTPPARASLVQAPTRVDLWFNERLEPTYARLSVWDASGHRVDAADVVVDPTEPTHLSVGVPALGAGTYTVKFRVVSVDGHVVESQFPFTVRAAR